MDKTLANDLRLEVRFIFQQHNCWNYDGRTWIKVLSCFRTGPNLIKTLWKYLKIALYLHSLFNLSELELLCKEQRANISVYARVSKDLQPSPLKLQLMNLIRNKCEEAHCSTPPSWENLQLRGGETPHNTTQHTQIPDKTTLFRFLYVQIFEY
ncbi:hypothetical protein AMECASPLE_009581 [Ameca splendens]|uniref:Uncharacterized protein n=1 Tax=Ameca splendens TaxID=208324 RepID=A0ABV0YYZ5_9TELE